MAQSCEIYSVVYRNTFRWRWRHTSASGQRVDAPGEYDVLFDCVAAARANGYEPRSSWTRVLALQEAR